MKSMFHEMIFCSPKQPVLPQGSRSVGWNKEGEVRSGDDWSEYTQVISPKSFLGLLPFQQLRLLAAHANKIERPNPKLP